jgi:glutamyl-tRNA synthetase
MPQPVRVRFAPSPTGYLHIGGLRTALYNFLFARKNNGIFILRIEDTDRSRYVEGSVENLISNLHWAGIEYDEGPAKDGTYGPYIQSERLQIYKKHADILIQSANAYRCFCTSDRLEAMRREQEREKKGSKYDRTCLRLTPEEIRQKLDSGIPYVIRMKIPESQSVSFDDLIREHVEFKSVQLDDQVLMKSDGYPTYHLAHVVDDHLMRITHVIRGEEWLSSTPKHILLYQFFGWDVPAFAHLPLLLNPDKSKLSKRQGDVAVEDYIVKGYLKEALINFIALLGWNPGDEREIFNLDDLVKEFSLERVGKAGAVFNIEKLDWLNFQHLHRKSDVEVLTMLKGLIARSAFGARHFDDEYLLHVIQVMRERVTFVKDFLEKSPYFFQPPEQYDQDAVKKRWTEKTPEQLEILMNALSQIPKPQKEDYETTLHQTADALKIKPADLIHPMRLAVSGMGAGPGLYDILFILGKDETIRRIKSAIENLGS